MGNQWYDTHIEGPVRDIVRHLRNEGINTVGSCGHRRWVSYESGDASKEISTVVLTLDKMGITEYRLFVRVYGIGDGTFTQLAVLYFPDENGAYCKKDVNNPKYKQAKCARIS